MGQVSDRLLQKERRDTGDVESTRPEPAGDGFEPIDLRYIDRPKQLSRGNAVSPLNDGDEIFAAMLGAISGARRSVCLETYIIEPDNTGKRFAEAMVAAAGRGVVVRLLYDAVGGFELTSAFLRRLRDAGVEIVEFHPVAPWRQRWNLSRRDHRKILVVDDAIGFLGGVNISDDYASEEAGGSGWRDVHCEIRGPAVLELARLFRRVWTREGGKSYPLTDRRAEDIGDGAAVRIVDNRKYRKRWAIRRAYTTAINAASESIAISNAYFLPDRGVRLALERAVERGVEVKVIVPEHSDVKAIQYAGEYMYGRLIRSGIEILCWPRTMMHAKTAVIDRKWSAIGSYNLDNRSLIYNLEVVAVILDRRVGALMQQTFETDSERCRALTAERYSQRGWFRRLLGWVFFHFRKWL